MMRSIKELLNEIGTPSVHSEGIYVRVLICVAHGLIGGALVGVSAWLVFVAYALGKELVWDWWHCRGSLRDSIHDIGAVGFGSGLASHFGLSVSIAFSLILAYGVVSAIIYARANG